MKKNQHRIDMKIYEIKVTLGGLFEGNSKKEVIEKMKPQQLIMIDLQINSLGKLDNVIDFQSYKERKKQ
jgi:hypothetical protein|tara:strand:+ start:209 stop:415 length:207 start_codon:yes stop_codon:yes gene_type:complete